MEFSLVPREGQFASLTKDTSKSQTSPSHEDRALVGWIDLVSYR